MYDFTLTGLFNTDLNTAYNAFSDPTVFVKWFAPDNLVVTQFISDYTQGGQYQVVLQSPEGFQQTVVGTFQDIVHNRHLSFTWRWDDTNDITKVRVEFTSTANLSTRVTLTQSGFEYEKDVAAQQYNWVCCLEKLSRVTWRANEHSDFLVA